MRYACSEKAKAEASDEGFGLFTWGFISLLVEHNSAKTPHGEQGDVKEGGIDLLVMPDD